MKKKVNAPPAYGPMKPMSEMTDAEFIQHADYLSTPYYKSYMGIHAREDAAYGNEYFSLNYPSFAREAAPLAGRDARAVKRNGDCIKKRGFIICVALILLLFCAFFCVADLLAISALPDFNIFSIYYDSYSPDNKSFTVIDFLTGKGVGLSGTDSAWIKTCEIATAVFSVLALLFVIFGIIRCFMALFVRKGANRCYKKRSWGTLTLFSAVFFVLIIVFANIAGNAIEGGGFDMPVNLTACFFLVPAAISWLLSLFTFKHR